MPKPKAKSSKLPLGQFLGQAGGSAGGNWAEDDTDFRATVNPPSSPPQASSPSSFSASRPAEKTSTNWRALRSDEPTSAASPTGDRESPRADDRRGPEEHGEYHYPQRRYEDRGDYRRDSDDHGEFRQRRSEGRGDYHSRPPAPLPTEPPFTAYVGNLSYDVRDTELVELFQGLEISSIRLMDRGFGYVEFGNLEDLKKAIELNGTNFLSRTLRVDAASKPKSSQGGDRRFGDRDRDRGFGGPRDRDDRDHGFVPRGRRDEPREERALPDNWRNQAAAKDILPTFHDHSARDEQHGERRPRGRPSAGDRDRERGGVEHAEQPRERPRVNLQPRSTDSPVLAPANYQKVNPFGQARPRDENEIMRKKEEEWKHRQQQNPAPAAPAETTATTPAPAAPSEQPSSSVEAPKSKKPAEEKKKPEPPAPAPAPAPAQQPQQQQPQTQKKPQKENEPAPKQSKSQPATSNQKAPKQPETVDEPSQEGDDSTNWQTVPEKKKRDRQSGKAK